MIERRIILVIVAPVIFFGCWGDHTVLAQDELPIKVDTALLNIPVFVSDKSGSPVKGLAKEDFELSVNRKKQKIDFFADKGPINVAIIIDSNSNTRDVLGRMKRDAQRFIDLLEPQDKAIVIRLDIGYKIMCELSSDKKKLRSAIGKIDSHQDRIRAMDKVLHQVIFYELAGIEGRKVVIVLGDADSTIPLSNAWYFKHAQNWLAESDTAIYPIFYQTATFPREFLGRNLTIDQLVKIPPVDSFHFFAVCTGGRFYVADANNFKSAFQHILEEIRSQYVLSIYLDGETGDEKNANLSIKTVRQDLILRAKQKIRADATKERKKDIERLMVVRQP